MDVVGEAADGAEVLALVRELRPDVVVMDLAMPEVDGIAATVAIRTELPESVAGHVTSILAKLGMQSRTEAAVHAVQSGLVPPGSR